MSNQEKLTFKVPWKIVFKIWWAFFWRFIIISEAINLVLIPTSLILLILMGIQLSEIEDKIFNFLVSSVGNMIACVLGFRLILFKKYKGFSLQIVPDNNKWKICQTFGWSFFWRWFIFSGFLAVLIGGISGFMIGFMGARDLIPIISSIYGTIVRIVLSLFLLKLMLQKRFSKFSLTISKSI